MLDDLKKIPLDDAMELFGQLSDDHEDYMLYLLIQAATFERFQRIELENMYKNPAHRKSDSSKKGKKEQ